MSFALALVFFFNRLSLMYRQSQISFSFHGCASFMLTIFLTFPETDSTPLVNSVMKPLHAAKIDRQEKAKALKNYDDCVLPS